MRNRAFPLRGRGTASAVDEVRPRSGRAVITSLAEVKIVQFVGATIGRPCRDDNFRQGKTLRAVALAVPLFRYRPQTGGLALRAEFLFLSLPKEKETKKKGNLRAAPLKIPLIVQSCHAQSKTVCLLSPQLRVALRAMKYTKQEKKEMWVRPSVAHRACTDITSSAQEPSPRYTVTFGQVGKASLRIKILRQHNKGKAKSNFAVILTVGAKLHFDHRNASFAAILTVGAKFVFRGNARRRRSGGKSENAT